MTCKRTTSAGLLLASMLAVALAAEYTQPSDSNVIPAVHDLVKEMEHYPIGPHKDASQVATLLESTVEGPAAEHVILQWEDDKYPAATISMLHAVQAEPSQKRAVADHTVAEGAVRSARRLKTIGLVSGAVDLVASAVQQQLEDAGGLIAKAFRVFDDADRALVLNLDSQYNRTIAPILAPLPFINISQSNAAKVVLNITAAKNQLLNQLCQSPVVIPSKRIPTRCVGPSARLNLVPASCAIEYFTFNKTRRFTCQPARLVINRTPGACNLAYNSSATFQGPSCIYRQQLGNITNLSFNGGEIRVPLTDVKTSVTSNFLNTILSLFHVSGDDSSIGIGHIIQSLTQTTAQTVAASLGQGTSLLSLLGLLGH